MESKRYVVCWKREQRKLKKVAIQMVNLIGLEDLH